MIDSFSSGNFRVGTGSALICATSETVHISTERIEELKDSEVVILPPPASEGYYHLWGKVRAALTYLADGHHREEFDWFLKADDDTFILVDNLRRFLNGRNPDDPFWYGSRLKSPKVAGGSYNSGGAGYLLGRRALTAFIQQEQPSSANCSRMHIGYEDLELGTLRRIPVISVDSNGIGFPDKCTTRSWVKF